jgi:hypothetical protein
MRVRDDHSSANAGGQRLRAVASAMEKADLRFVAARTDDLEIQFSHLKNAMMSRE